MTPFHRLSAAGFAATAITYGPARMGFGLYLPEFRATFAISSQEAGLVSGLGFFGFFLGLLAAQRMTGRAGPRRPVIVALAAATAGFAIVALAPGLPFLALGVFLAMSSAGFSWAPYNTAIHRRVTSGWRPTALSAVSTGTGLGIVAAAVAALGIVLQGGPWRLAWGLFAVAGAVTLLANLWALRKVAGTPQQDEAAPLTSLARSELVMPALIALSFGATSAIYLSFAADRIAGAGGLPGLPAEAAGSVLFIAYGGVGLAGLFTGAARERIGLAWLLRLLFLAAALSCALISWAPASWAGVIVSAGLQGASVMMISAFLAFWSEELFPARPSQSFTVVLLAVAAGSVLGPVAAGAGSKALGAGIMFLATAALPLVTALVLRADRIAEATAE